MSEGPLLPEIHEVDLSHFDEDIAWHQVARASLIPGSIALAGNIEGHQIQAYVSEILHTVGQFRHALKDNHIVTAQLHLGIMPDEIIYIQSRLRGLISTMENEIVIQDRDLPPAIQLQEHKNTIACLVTNAMLFETLYWVDNCFSQGDFRDKSLNSLDKTLKATNSVYRWLNLHEVPSPAIDFIKKEQTDQINSYYFLAGQAMSLDPMSPQLTDYQNEMQLALMVSHGLQDTIDLFQSK